MAKMGKLDTSGTDGHTLNYGWVKPVVGDDFDQWGDLLNQDLDAIDQVVGNLSSGVNLKIATEQVTVTSVNAFASLAHTPNMSLFILYIDGEAFFPAGTTPDFSISGNTITWLNTIYSAVPASTVIAVYTWS